jgi:hypothetical protein
LSNGIIVIKSMKMRWSGHVGKKVSSCKDLEGKPEGKR